MEPVTAVITSVIGPVVLEACRRLFDRWWGQPGTEQGLVFDPQRGVREIPSVSGTLKVADVTAPHPTTLPDVPPVTISGGFLFEESLDWLRGDEVVLLLVFETNYQAHGQVYLFEFDLGGYILELWPGDYFFYTLVLDPEAPSLLDAEIIALGYPDFGEVADPNPILVSGYGVVTMDMLVLDRLEFPDAPCFLSELAISGG